MSFICDAYRVIGNCNAQSTDDFKNERIPVCVRISAKTGEGIDDLLFAVQQALPQTRKRVKMLIPFHSASLVAKIRNDGIIFSEEYTEKGILIDAVTEILWIDQIKDYIV